MKIRNILVPVDFSERSEHGAQHAVVLARRFGARLTFLHVVPPSPYEYAAFDEGFYAAATWPQQPEVRETLLRRLDELASRVAPGLDVETIVVSGDPSLEIEDVAKEKDADLVMLPTHGYGAFRKLVLGSVTSKVLHDVSRPVFTGAHVDEPTPVTENPYQRVACAVDLGEHSEATLRWAHAFAGELGAELTVIHAAPMIEAGGTYGDWFPPDTREQVEGAARKSVADLLAKAGVLGAEVRVASARTVPYVSDMLAQTKADVAVIGRSTHEGPIGDLLADAYALIRRSPCPVISV